MNNPLIEKYEEMYGSQKEEQFADTIVGSDGVDTISCNSVTNLNTSKVNLTSQFMNDSGVGGGFTINSSHLTQLMSPTYETLVIPCINTNDKHLISILKDLNGSKAIIKSIDSEVNRSYVGFGCQIDYTIRITSTYP